MIDINKIEEIMKKEGNEKEFEYKGYKCFIHRMTYDNGKKLGHLNGYVKLPDNHKFTKIDYYDTDFDLTANINYSECHLPYCESEIGWYFGMSYDHIYDINPLTMYVMNYDHKLYGELCNL